MNPETAVAAAGRPGVLSLEDGGDSNYPDLIFPPMIFITVPPILLPFRLGLFGKQAQTPLDTTVYVALLHNQGKGWPNTPLTCQNADTSDHRVSPRGWLEEVIGTCQESKKGFY